MARNKKHTQKSPGPLVVRSPQENAKAHARVMARLRKMTPAQIFETLIRSGIYTRSGKLKKPYAPTADDHLY
jgi:hypothetical protein